MVKILLDCDKDQQIRATYVFEHIFTACGILYKIESGIIHKSFKAKNDDELKIYYGSADNSISPGKDFMYVPLLDYSDWLQTEKIKVKYIDDIPILYLDQEPSHTIKNGRFGFDLVNAIFFLLSRQEEKIIKDKDNWGRFPSAKSVLKKLGLLKRPIINYYIKIFKHYIIDWHRKRKFPLSLNPIWKGNKDFAVALTHDVDIISKYNINYGTSLLKNSLNRNLHGLKGGLINIGGFLIRNLFNRPDLYWNFEDWINLEESLNMKSSFYFFSKIEDPHILDVTYNFKEKIKFEDKTCNIQHLFSLIREKGWEVGLHGSFHSYNDEDRVKNEKRSFEKNLNGNICGIRQHFLRFDVEATWKILENQGFIYDSSLGYGDTIGYRAGIGFPFYPFDLNNKRAMNILELPLTVMDVTLFRPEDYHLNTLQATDLCTNLIDEIETVNGLIVFLWHTYAKDEKKYQKYWKVYKNLLEYLSSKNCWVTSSEEIAKWWRQKTPNTNG